MPAEKLIDVLRARPVVFDGAMGTALYERGVLYTNNMDQQTVTKPELVASVHRMHLEAGADVNVLTADGSSAVALAVRSRHLEVVELLLEPRACVQDTAPKVCDNVFGAIVTRQSK